MNIDKIIEEVLQQIPQPLWENWYIKEKIGTGSFSSVFRVEAVRAKRVDSAALKVEPILPDERLASNAERSLSYLKQKRADIEEESTIMYKLKDCQNVVGYEDEDVKEFHRDGKLAGYIFLIRMELLQNVYDLMNSQQLNTVEANIIRLGKEIGSGLKAAHDIGVIHRDVKPSNFFISKNGTYKLGDFNIAKQTSYTHSFAGTEGYIAPEVYMAKSGNASAYSAQADIYSLGICLYQFMNNGLFPFEDTVLTEEAIDKRMSGEELPPPSNASDSFSKIILKACAYEADTRYANMSEMLADLDKLNAPKVDAYVSGSGFAATKSPATVYAGNTSYSSGNETKYADSSVYMQPQAVEAGKRSRKKAIITVSAIIALIAVLGGLLFFAAKKLNDKNYDTESRTSANGFAISEETATTSSVQTTTVAETTTEATTTTTKDPHEFVGIINTKSDDLSVRAAPSYDAEILGTIPKDTEVKAYTLDDNKDWCRIEYSEKGLSGYSCSHYIINKDNPDESVPHDWLEATYTSPKKCSVCGATEGSTLLPPSEYTAHWTEGQGDVKVEAGYISSWIYDIDNDAVEECIAKYDCSGKGLPAKCCWVVFEGTGLGEVACWNGYGANWNIIKDNNIGRVYLAQMGENYNGDQYVQIAYPIPQSSEDYQSSRILITDEYKENLVILAE
ncbi:serine/threonine protein kinase [Ruminococcus flavefaciens]|uniref:serine/threonine protein kinase n=1 Tax=Ruminococcus flavefaciens TaxID=1265 RepID=UPI00046422E0|nr:serine/threonine protein kinase [Ruminococcus flavefaciens]